MLRSTFLRISLLWILLVGLGLAGCSSYYNLDSQGKRGRVVGGFRDEKIDVGLYYIEATTGVAPFNSPARARKTFERRATELCGEGFVVLWSSDLTYNSAPGSPGAAAMNVTTVAGYVIAKDSPLSLPEAKAAVNRTREKDGLNPLTEWFR